MNNMDSISHVSALQETPYRSADDGTADRRGFFASSVIEKYWRSLIRHRIIVSGILVSFLVIGLVATLLMTPLYTAAAQIEISRAADNVTNVEGLENEDVGQGLEFYQTQYTLLESRSLARRVARSLNLANDAAFLQGFNLGEAAAIDNGDAASRNALEREILNLLGDNIGINPIRGSSLVDVAFTSPDSGLSAKIANEWTTQFIQSNLDRRMSSTDEARKVLLDQLSELRTRLEQSESDLVNYASDNRIIALSTTENSDGDTRTERTLVASDLEALNGELALATAERIRAQSALHAARGVSEAALTNNTITALRQQYAILESEYARLMQQFEPSYPPARALRTQIDSLASAIEEEERRVRAGVVANYEEAVSREGALGARVESLKGELIGQRRDSIQYAIYQREVDTNRQIYDGLLQRYKEIGVAGVGNNNVAIVDRAQPPEEPSSPRPFLNLVLALMLGAAFSIALIVILEYIDQSLKDPNDVDQVLGLPLLGSIPREHDDMVESIHDAKSQAAEAYLSVRTNLGFRTDHGVPRSFMLTSSAPNEGKSISSLALALSIANTGKRVALLDADMRNPSLDKLTGRPNTTGLSNVLSGQADWRDLITVGNDASVEIITTGPMPPNAAELLSGAKCPNS